VPELPAPTEQAYLAAIERWNASPQGAAFPEWDRPMRRRQLKLILALVPPGGLVVDIGTGAGIVPSALVESMRRVLSVDTTEGDESLETWLHAHGGATAVATVGPEPIPLEDGQADAILLADVIEHLPGSPLPLLGEAARVLRPGGSLVLTTPNATRLHARIKLLFGRSNWPPLAFVYGHDIHPSHHREYTATELDEVLGRGGFTDVRITTIEERLYRIGPAGRLAARCLMSLLPTLAGDLIVTACRRGPDAELLDPQVDGAGK
jgi:SAM-dependent methyltransferase